MTDTFKEAVEMLEEGIGVKLIWRGYEYEVSPADNWVGGDGMDGYISQVLGNVVYDSAEHVLRNSIEFLEEDGEKVEIKF